MVQRGEGKVERKAMQGRATIRRVIGKGEARAKAAELHQLRNQLRRKVEEKRVQGKAGAREQTGNCRPLTMVNPFASPSTTKAKAAETGKIAHDPMYANCAKEITPFTNALELD